MLSSGKQGADANGWGRVGSTNSVAHSWLPARRVTVVVPCQSDRRRHHLQVSCVGNSIIITPCGSLTAGRRVHCHSL
jgi:hypothetical protein